jgi:tetratricopeptide (TPR) repeat protein
MDRRKLIYLSGMVVGSLVGCNHQQVVNNPDTAAQAQSAASSGDGANQTASRSAQKPEPTEIDAKPSSIVQIADVQAAVVADEARSPQDRQNAVALAKKNYRRAIQLDPKYIPAYLGLAHVCSDAGEHDEAILVLDTALAKFPREGQLWYDRGMVMGRLRRYDEAIRNLQKAVEIDSKNPKYGKSMGLMLARMGRDEEGVAWLKKWMSEADARYNVARLMEHMGLTAESQRQLQLALKADPGHQATLELLNEQASTAINAPSPYQSGADDIQQTGAMSAGSPMRINSDGAAQASTLPERSTAGVSDDARQTPAIASKPPAPIPVWATVRSDTAGKDTRKQPAVQLGFEPNP